MRGGEHYFGGDMTVERYLTLITSEHRDRPKFQATVQTTVSPFAKVQEILRSLIPAYDVDEAVGVQLDAVALWIGATRAVPVPIAGYYFTWDDVVADGWDNGVWKGIGDPDAGFSVLPDDLFRLVLKSKISANNWKGDIPGAYNTLAEAYGASDNITIKDNGNMTMTVTIKASAIPAVQLALLTQGLIPIKPAGVTADYVTV